MRFIIRGVAAGLLAGAAFYFFPFLFQFLFFFLLTGIILRLAFGRRRGHGRRFGPGFMNGQHHDRMYGDPISINGSRFVPAAQASGNEIRIPVK